MLAEFDLTVFMTNYCAIMGTLNTTLTSRDIIYETSTGQMYTHKNEDASVHVHCSNCTHHYIAASDSFFIYSLFVSNEYKNILHKYDNQLLKKLTHHLIEVYTSLWSSPSVALIEASNYIIAKYLGFNYTTIHKRSLEGGCSEVISHNIGNGDFSILELPMNNSEWKGDIGKFHPLCEMTATFVDDTLHMHHRENNPLFVSFDGQGNVSALLKYGALFSSDFEFKSQDTINHKFLDMILAINGDFFVLNPRSTFSWQIFVIRTVLGLESVPILRNKDFYMRMSKESDRMSDIEGLWISWAGVITEVKNYFLS